MKVTRGGIVVVAVAICLALAAQTLNAQGVKDPDLIGDAVTGAEGCTPLPDDVYDGTIGSMTCAMYSGPTGPITDMQAELGINHTWAGDLTVKIVSPSMEVLTVMSRPGDPLPDDGTGCCGNNADMASSSPVSFFDGGTYDAETMGSAGTVVCQDDGQCEYFPNPDTGPGTDFSQFIGQEASGDWMLCVADAAGGDTGEVCASDLQITVGEPVPTVPRAAMILLLVVLASVALFALRRTSFMS